MYIYKLTGNTKALLTGAPFSKSFGAFLLMLYKKKLFYENQLL